jgi:hypothetical protein
MIPELGLRETTKVSQDLNHVTLKWATVCLIWTLLYSYRTGRWWCTTVMDSRGSLSCSQQQIIDACLEHVQSSPQLYMRMTWDLFNIILPSVPWSLSSLLYKFLMSPMCNTFPTHLSLLDLTTLICVECKLWRPLWCSFCHPPVSFSLTGTNMLFFTLLSHPLSYFLP